MQSQNMAAHPGFERLFGLSGTEGRVSLSAIRERANKQLTRFSELAIQRLHEREISVPPAISLVNCPGCDLTLENIEHPEAQEILAWLQQDIEIAKLFKEVEVLFEIVRAAEYAGDIFPETSCFHIGLTSAGPIAYFEGHLCIAKP